MNVRIHIVTFLILCVATAHSRRWASSAANPFLVSHRQVASTSAISNKSYRSSSSLDKTISPKQTVSVSDVATLTMTQRLLSGGCSRGIAQVVLYPMDALRTLAQTRDGRTLADVGAKALVRGCVTTSSFAIFIGSIQFAIFGATRDHCGPVVSSALGAAGSCLVSVPQEVIKQRLVTGVYSNFRSAVATIYKTEGLRGFYSAWRPTVARNVPFVVATFTAMDYMKRSALDFKRKHDENPHGVEANDFSLTVFENLLIGISSSLMGATLTHPADVIKTRMMTQAASTALPYSSTIDCITTMWKNEGINAFYSGFAQRSAYMGPLWAMQFALNGKFSTVFKTKNVQATELMAENR